MKNTTSIPLQIDINRVLEVLATQIYQSPLALLRENLQNAYDAILLRKSKGDEFYASIEVTLSTQEIKIQDNGIGMSRDDMEKHFWRAGSSSKNTPEAKAAGVVGTFGIGAMANFGIAESLTVESENDLGGERTRSSARRDNLSATENCIEIDSLNATGMPGTKITASLYEESPLNIKEAISYLTECVQYLTVPVVVNDTLVSQRPFGEEVKPLSENWSTEKIQQIGPNLEGKIRVVGDGNGEVFLSVTDIIFGDQPVIGQIILRSGLGVVKTYRSGFSLATTSVTSVYQFGGVADLAILQPTAGREALDTSSQQFLQNIVTQIENFVSIQFSGFPTCDKSTRFLQWVLNNNRIDLCDEITIRYEPNQVIPLKDLRGRKHNLYCGQDSNIIKQYASDESRLAVLALVNPRLTCQKRYLKQFSTSDFISDAPKIKSIKDTSDYSLMESSLVFRITSILESDYFLNADVKIADFTHLIPVIVDKESTPISVFVNPNGSNVTTLTELYGREYEVYGHMVKDFVRNIIFPMVADRVPSATREGAEAFLKRMRLRREVFEYERNDLGNLNEIWQDVIEGKITISEGARRSQSIARQNIQVVEAAQPATDVIPDLSQIDNPVEETAGVAIPMPAISRSDIETNAKLLVIPENQPALNNYRCFLAITDRVFEEKGDFFLQPHTTDIVWGGQRALFVFKHHSGEFGLYYDIQAPNIISAQSGGGPHRTATIFLKNKVFFPIPSEIQASFIPAEGVKKRLEVRCDLLYTSNNRGQGI